jgi:hypothetical protein
MYKPFDLEGPYHRILKYRQHRTQGRRPRADVAVPSLYSALSLGGFAYRVRGSGSGPVTILRSTLVRQEEQQAERVCVANAGTIPAPAAAPLLATTTVTTDGGSCVVVLISYLLRMSSFA